MIFAGVQRGYIRLERLREQPTGETVRSSCDRARRPSFVPFCERSDHRAEPGMSAGFRAACFQVRCVGELPLPFPTVRAGAHKGALGGESEAAFSIRRPPLVRAQKSRALGEGPFGITDLLGTERRTLKDFSSPTHCRPL